MKNKPKTNKWVEELNNIKLLWISDEGDEFLGRVGDAKNDLAIPNLIKELITQTQQDTAQDTIQETLEWVKKDARAHFNSSENEEISEFWFNVIEWLSHTIKKRMEVLNEK